MNDILGGGEQIKMIIDIDDVAAKFIKHVLHDVLANFTHSDFFRDPFLILTLILTLRHAQIREGTLTEFGPRSRRSNTRRSKNVVFLPLTCHLT